MAVPRRTLAFSTGGNLLGDLHARDGSPGFWGSRTVGLA